MKATAERSPVELTGRSLIAGEVRAVLARKNLNSNTLPSIAGRTQTYWYSRLNAKVSFSSELVEHGIDIRVVQELMLHEDLGTTQVYTRVSEHRKTEGILALPVMEIPVQAWRKAA